MKIVYICLLTLAMTAQAFAQAVQRLSIPDASKVLTPPLTLPAAVPVQPAPPQLDAPSPGTGHLLFHSVRVIGATRLPTQKIAAQFAALQNKDIPASELKPVLDSINTLYAEAGLPLGRAFIPAQRLKGGELTVRVVEGFVEKITVHSSDARLRALVEYMAAPITAERPLTRGTLERVMLLLQELPGITLGSKFDDIDIQTGGTTLVLDASVKTVTVGFALDNRSALASLPALPYAITTLNNVFGMGDQIVLTALLSPQQKDFAFYAISASRPIGNYGLSAGVEASWAQALDDVSLRPYAVRSRSAQLATRLQYALIRKSDESLTAVGRIYFTRAAYSLANLGILAQDQYVAAELGADYARSLADDLQLGGTLRLGQGLASLTGEPHTRLNTVPGFTKARAQAKMVWRPQDKVTLNFSATGQYSPSSLVASEEIAFGGLAYGRGFSVAETTGDSGFGLSFQPEYKIALDEKWSLSPFLSTDYARSFNHARDLQANVELVSAGGGVKIGLEGFGNVTLEMDKPLNRTPYGRSKRDWRLFIGVEIGLDKVAAFIGQNL